MPGAAIADAAVIGPPMRDGFFNCCADTFQVVGEIARIETGLDRHHAATNIHANCRGNNGAFGRDHASDSRTNAPMNVWHRGDPLEHERELRRIQELLPRGIFDGHALGPGFDRHAVSGAITL